MEKLVPVIMCAVLIVLAWLIIRIATRASSTIARRRIIAYPEQTPESLDALFCSCFGVRNVFSNVCVPCKIREDNGVSKYTRLYASSVVILNSGIAVIGIRSDKGIIDATGDSWKKDTNDYETGERTVSSIDSPALETRRFALALKDLITKYDVHIPAIYNFVIFTSKSLHLTSRPQGVYFPLEALSELRTLNRDKRLTALDKRAYRGIIKKSYRLTRQNNSKK